MAHSGQLRYLPMNHGNRIIALVLAQLYHPTLNCDDERLIARKKES